LKHDRVECALRLPCKLERERGHSGLQPETGKSIEANERIKVLEIKPPFPPEIRPTSSTLPLGYDSNVSENRAH
jgi:hypothetical protein